MMTNNKLIIFTESYPYSHAAEDSFIEPELKACQREFSRIIIIPAQLKGTRALVSNEVTVDEGYAKYLTNRSHGLIGKIILVWKILLSQLFWQEILSDLTAFFRPADTARILRHISGAIITKDWIRQSLIKNALIDESGMILTYWLNSTTMGLVDLKRKYHRLTVCSRAHGIDVYLERQNPPLFPCRDRILRQINGVYFTSAHARNYTDTHYPGYEEKLHIASLGVPDPGWINQPSSDGKIRLVSCSSIIPVKRIDLMAKGIAEFAATFPQYQVIWHHIGEGHLRQDITAWCRNQMPANVECEFTGPLPNREVMLFYKGNLVDLFMNMSASEGGRPVAIMEAMSCGIPALGPDQGGISEIISESNGLLLPPDPEAREIAQGLLQIVNDRPGFINRRKQARETWKQYFDSEKNGANFAVALSQMINPTAGGNLV